MKPTLLAKSLTICYRLLKATHYISKFYLIKSLIIVAIITTLTPVASAGVNITSITRNEPLNENTGVSSVVFAVLFDGPVTGADASNFTLTVNGVSGTSITNIAGSGNTYYITANTGTGDGTIRLDLISQSAISPSIYNIPYTIGEYYTIDKTAPASPVISGISDDSGSNTADGITNDQTLIFNGTAEANSKVTINHAVLGMIGSILADDNGNWIFDYTSTTLSEDVHIFSATAEDRAGNVSIASPDFTVTVDIIAYSPSIIKIKDDTGVRNDDQVTNDPSLIFSGTSEPYASVIISREGSGILDTISAASNGNWTFDFSGTILSNGIHTFSAISIDMAGNTSSPCENFIVTIDLVAPAAPSISGVSEDAGFSNSDKITNDQGLNIRGIAEINSMIIISRTGLGMIGTAYADENGNWTFDYSGTILSDGNYTFTAIAVDPAGNVSSISPNFTVTIDTTLPGSPIILSITNDSGPDNADNITNDLTISINGTAEANSMITFTKANSGILGLTQADINGNWTFDYDGTTLSSDSYALVVTAMDIAGNMSNPGTSSEIVIDAILPKPVISSMDTDPAPSSPVTIQIDFSENVIGFSIDDIAVTGGSKSNFNGSGSIYTLDVTSSGSDPFTIEIAADMVMDSAGNGNEENSFQIVYGPCSSPVLSASPSDTAVCEGEQAGFSIKASGNYLSYQWLVDEGSGFTRITDASVYSGMESNKLTISEATSSMNSYVYKCMVAGTCVPSVTSSTALLTVKPLPDVIFSLNGNNSICDSSPELSLPSGSPATGIYSGKGVSGNKFNPSLAGSGDHTITYTNTGANGCTNSQSDILSVSVCTDIFSDVSENNLITIYPNPVQDILRVSCNLEDKLTIEVNNSQGQTFLNQHLQSGQNNLSFQNYQPGIYLIRIWKNDELIKQEKVVKY